MPVEGPRIYNWWWEPPRIVSTIVPIYWGPFHLSDNAKRALKYVDNKPSNLHFCAATTDACAFVGSKSQTLGINFNPLKARLAHMIIPNPM